MLNKQDIALLKGMLEIQKKDIILDVRDEIHSCISASEARMMAKMHDMKIDIIHDVAELIDGSILPQTSDLDRRVSRLERYVKIA
ncbi:MAG: hypothetical protein WAZ14_02735 [Patescibacteria group bacterium]